MEIGTTRLIVLVLLGGLAALAFSFQKDYWLWRFSEIGKLGLSFSEIRALRKRNQECQKILEGFLMLKTIELNATISEVEKLYQEDPHTFIDKIKEEVTEAFNNDGEGKRWKWEGVDNNT